MVRWLVGLLWKDVKLFGVDRQAVVMSFVVPVLIATILGWLDSKASSDKPEGRVPILFVDEDRSDVSRAVFDRLKRSDSVAPKAATEAEADRQVRGGDVSAAVVLPKGFGSEASAALTGGGPKPPVTLLTDPSKPTDAQVAEGAVMAEASGAVASQTFGALAGSASAPLTLVKRPASAKEADWSKAAHDYAGFGLQGLLFFAIESAVSLSRERRQGIWRRLRAAPVPSGVFVLSKGISSTAIAFGIVLAMFAFGALLFGIRILGSGLGFFAVALTTALMAAGFGLLVSTLGRTETQSRGLSVLIILVMLATGGAWFPLRQMPSWVQSAAEYLPVRWAVEGFDAATWRGLGLADSMKNAGVLLAFAAVFAALALLRFRAMRDPA